MADGGSLEFVEESPSSWAEWVEMLLSTTISFVLSGLRPRGRSGLKFDLIGASEGGRESPSSWAEWVEIFSPRSYTYHAIASPSSWAEWVEIPNHNTY